MSATNQWSRMLRHPGHKLPSTGTNHSSAILFFEHTHSWHRANHSVFYSLRAWVSEQTFQRVSNRMIDTCYHYKLSNKHVTEVSTAVWNCLNELQWLKDITCLPWSSRTRIVTNYKITEQEPVQKQGGMRGNLSCGQKVLVDSHRQIWLYRRDNTRK